MRDEILEMGKKARDATHLMGMANSNLKREALQKMASALELERESIGAANRKDVEEAERKGLGKAKIDRLIISEKVLQEMIDGLQEVSLLPDPVGEVTRMWTRPNGLRVGRMRIPLGVIGIVYESRPNVTVDAAALCIKAGNAVILRGGSEAFHSNSRLAGILRESLKQTGLPEDAVQFVEHHRPEGNSGSARPGGICGCHDSSRGRGSDTLCNPKCKDARLKTLQGRLPCLRRFGR